MSGYTIGQLLEWTLRDHLIEGYTIASDGRIEIFRDGKKHVLKHRSAEKMLRKLIRDINNDLPHS